MSLLDTIYRIFGVNRNEDEKKSKPNDRQPAGARNPAGKQATQMLDIQKITADIPDLNTRRRIEQVLLESARKKKSAASPLQDRHLRGLQMNISAVKGSVPASILRRDAFFTDPWWSHSEAKKADAVPPVPPDKQIKRPDGSIVLSEAKFAVTLLDGRKLNHIRRVLLSVRGKRFKEFLLQADDGKQLSMAEVAPVLPLYGLERFDPQKYDEIVIAEGVAAAEALIGIGFAAAGTLTGALHTPPVAALAPAAVFKTVYLWPDNDSIGVRHMERIAARLYGLGARDIRVIHWKNGPRKGDAADFQEAQPGVKTLMAEAKKWTLGSSVRNRGQLAINSARMPMSLSLSIGARTPTPAIDPQTNVRKQASKQATKVNSKARKNPKPLANGDEGLR
jgi:hypothetical protein